MAGHHSVYDSLSWKKGKYIVNQKMRVTSEKKHLKMIRNIGMPKSEGNKMCVVTYVESKFKVH